MVSVHKAKLKSLQPLVIVAGIILIVAGAGLGAWAWLQHRQASVPTYTGPVERVTTGLIGEYAALILIAQDQGYFKAAGLDVTLKDYSSGPAALADLLAGKLDTAMGADFAGVRNSFAGEDLKILAIMSKAEAFDMIARRDHDISTIADLKGKQIGVTRKTVGEFYLGQFLTFNKLSLSDVSIIDLPQPDLLERLKAAVLMRPCSLSPMPTKPKPNSALVPSAGRFRVAKASTLSSIARVNSSASAPRSLNATSRP